MSKIFKIPVTWEMYGVVEIEAETIEEAIDKFDKDSDSIDLPEGNYVDASFHREDEETIKLLN